MISGLMTLRGIGMGAITIKLVLAVLLGGTIGVERELKRRSAGSRTHILICLGAAMTMIANQQMILSSANVDPARIGAQVVAGIGFIGAGTIVVSHRNKVRGLTTAAGLWATAVIGLALGCGYFECAIALTLLILFTESFLSKIEWIRNRKQRPVALYVEYKSSKGYVSRLLDFLANEEISILDMEVLKNDDSKNVLLLTVLLNNNINEEELSIAVEDMPDTITTEIL